MLTLRLLLQKYIAPFHKTEVLATLYHGTLEPFSTCNHIGIHPYTSIEKVYQKLSADNNLQLVLGFENHLKIDKI